MEAAEGALGIDDAASATDLVERVQEEALLDSARDELAAIQRELARRRWSADYCLWVEERLKVILWSVQKKIVRSVQDNRRTAVPSCHEAGKSFTAATVVACFLDVHKPGDAFVVTSAPTGHQVKAILWREINRAHGLGQLRGRTNLTEWYMVNPRTGKEELVAFGRKPADMNPGAFQGIHAPAVLVVFDEACWILKNLWDAADSLIANENSRFLAIGNPDAPGTEFAEICKPGSGWNVVRISAYDTPNFTGEPVPPDLHKSLIGPTWVEEKRKKWGEDSPLFKAKVLGEFPERATDGLIPLNAINAAGLRELPALLPDELGCDVGAGGDKNTVARRQGFRVRILRADNEPDTMASAGNLVNDLNISKARVAKVDNIGIGRGMVDKLKEDNRPVIGINVSVAAKNAEAFANLRAETYWYLRELFMEGNIDIDPDDDELISQLASIKYKRDSKGRILIESKEDMKRRGMPSPDRADAVMLAFCEPPDGEPKKVAGVLW